MKHPHRDQATLNPNLRENTMNSTERTALVTGATTGLGLEAAAQLAEQGYRQVIITGRTPNGLKQRSGN